MLRQKELYKELTLFAVLSKKEGITFKEKIKIKKICKTK